MAAGERMTMPAPTLAYAALERTHAAIAAHPAFTDADRANVYKAVCALHGPITARYYNAAREAVTKAGRPLWAAVLLHNPELHASQTPAPSQIMHALEMEAMK